MGRKIQLDIQQAADACFERFCEVKRLPEWVPGVKKAEVQWNHPNGLPAEVRFTFALGTQNAEYVLMYDYDPPTRRVVWYPVGDEPYVVRGSAKFDTQTVGCRMTYELELSRDREAEELGRAQALLEAFREWIGEGA